MLEKQFYFEKDIALDLSKKIRKKLKEKIIEFKTRSVDRTVLQKRAEIAQKVNADSLFQSTLMRAITKKLVGLKHTI